jgi:polysaccharide biosynthesis/export protein
MLIPKRLGVLLTALVLTSLSLIGQGQTAGSASKVDAPPPKADPNGAPVGVNHKTYEIGVQDVLRIEVWQNGDLTRLVTVRPDGKFSMPLIGDVQAEGLTPERLEAQLEEALREQIVSPDVTVSVQQVNSKSYRVNGWVNRPGPYPLVTPIRVYEAIADAGGFREYANLKDVIIIRGSKRIKFNAAEYRKTGKNADQNILLENGDIVEIHD